MQSFHSRSWPLETLRRATWSVLFALGAMTTIFGQQEDVIVGGDRPATVHVPQSYDPKVPAPLLVSLHGCPSNAEGPYGENVMRYAPAANELGVLFVAPDGSGSGNRRSWGACSGSSIENSNYLRALIEEAELRLNVDPDRIFVAGYSDGAFMAYRMACDHPDKVAAIVCLAGKNSEGCMPTAPVAILGVHGADDNRIQLSQQISSISAWVRKFWPLEPIEAGPGPELVAGVETVSTVWRNACISESPAELWSLPGVGHFFDFLADGKSTRFARHTLEWLLEHPKTERPTAAARVSPETGIAPLEVLADASDSVVPADTTLESYCWSFGGPSRSGEATERVVFETPGVHQVGVAVTTDDGRVSTSAVSTVSVSCPTGDLGPWSATDIGEVRFAGGANFTDGAFGDAGEVDSCLSVCAPGRTLTAAKREDAAFFVFRELPEGGALTAEIESIDASNRSAAVGLMFREDFAPGARFAAVLVEKDGRLAFSVRLENGERIRRVYGETLAFPIEISIARQGDDLVGSARASGEDDSEWVEVGRRTIEGFGSPEAGDPLRGGLVATSGEPSTTEAFTALSAQACRLGFEAAPPPMVFLRGDANGDGAPDLSDGVYVLSWLFLGGPASGCLAAADANADGTLDVADPSYLLNHLFLGGPAPVTPFPDCGTSDRETDQELGCGESSCP